MRLIDGAQAIMGDLPSSATTVIDVPEAAGESLATGVQRYSALSVNRATAAAAVREQRFAAPSTMIVTIGGDCGSDLAAIDEVLAARENGSVAVVWFDAHADLNSPETSPSGAFGGMALRAVLGDGPDGLALRRGLSADHVVLAGARALDDAEAAYIDANGVRTVTVDELATPDALLAALEATGATSVYVHVDLDVLDPAEIEGVGYPEPFGVSSVDLIEAIRAIRRRFELVGAAIAGFAPASPDEAIGDLSVILRTLGAITAPLR